MSYLTAMIGIQNEAPYLAQWIEFHLLQGFDRFLVYDNRSTDNFMEVLAPYVALGLVEVIPVPEAFYDKAPGQFMCVDGIGRCLNTTQWYLATSIDEYTFTKEKTVLELLKNYSNRGGLAVSWVMFNSSGQAQRDDSKLVIEKFTQTYPEGTPHVKTICQPRFVKSIRDPHSYNYDLGKNCVNEFFEPVEGAHPARVTHELIQMNHYWTMSREEFDAKMNKGRSDIEGLEGRRRDGADDLWAHAHSGPQVHNFDAWRFVGPVRERLRQRALTSVKK